MVLVIKEFPNSKQSPLAGKRQLSNISHRAETGIRHGGEVGLN